MHSVPVKLKVYKSLTRVLYIRNDEHCDTEEASSSDAQRPSHMKVFDVPALGNGCPAGLNPAFLYGSLGSIPSAGVLWKLTVSLRNPSLELVRCARHCVLWKLTAPNELVSLAAQTPTVDLSFPLLTFL